MLRNQLEKKVEGAIEVIEMNAKGAAFDRFVSAG
jgi:hypothetical protein